MAADTYLYRLTYADGSVKHGHRRVAGPAIARTNTNAPNYVRGKIIRVERLPEPAEWEDVTAEFLKGA